mmetsp:Transcript_87942/g.250801  ORF Transcript_87942/g.250801 Transcript_87942/m.250801 type:complete len:238 (+) Transcript_87942:1919-2632(+)
MQKWACERATGRETRSEDRAVRTEGRHSQANKIDSYGNLAVVHLPLANIMRESRCRCLLENLLVPPLDRAVPLRQMHCVAVVVAKNLKLDVARALHEALKKDSVVAKSLEGFPLARVEGVQKVLGPFHKTHALATAAQRGLDQHRVFDALCLGLQSLRVLVVSVVTGSDRDVRIDHDGLGRALGPHRLDSGYRGTDERHIVRSTRRGEMLVLRQEAIAWMDATGACARSYVQNPVHV